MKENWPESLRRLLEHEGGNDDDPQDPGGRTSRGIIQTEWTRYVLTHPGQNLPADVWKAPDSAVEDIYRRQYWDALRCDELPAGVDYAVFDFGVNSGINRSARYLQGIVGTVQDGVIGPATLIGAKAKPAAQIISALCEQRLNFLRGLKTWPRFGKGWGRRVDEVRAAALAMATGKPVPKVPGAPAPVRPPAKPAAPASKPTLEPRHGIAAAISVAAAAFATWIGDHWLFGVCVVALALATAVLILHRKTPS